MSSDPKRVYHYSDERLAEIGYQLRKKREQEVVLKREIADLEAEQSAYVRSLPRLADAAVDKAVQASFFGAFNAVMALSDPLALRAMFNLVMQRPTEMRAWRSQYGETIEVAFQRRMQELGRQDEVFAVIATEAAAVERWSIIGCGSRDWPVAKRGTIRTRFAKLPNTTRLIHGANGYRDKDGKLRKGADMVCDMVAKQLGWPPAKAFPYRGELGKAGGPVRNREMLDELIRRRDRDGDRIVVIAFHDNLAASAGTLDMLDQARKREVPFELITG